MGTSVYYKSFRLDAVLLFASCCFLFVYPAALCLLLYITYRRLCVCVCFAAPFKFSNQQLACSHLTINSMPQSCYVIHQLDSESEAEKTTFGY